MRMIFVISSKKLLLWGMKGAGEREKEGEGEEGEKKRGGYCEEVRSFSLH